MWYKEVKHDCTHMYNRNICGEGLIILFEENQGYSVLLVKSFLVFISIYLVFVSIYLLIMLS